MNHATDHTGSSDHPQTHTTIASCDAGREFAGPPPKHLFLVFDGYCGFCARCVRWIRRLDRHHRITPLAGQTSSTYDTTTVTAAESQVAAWAVTPNGQRTSGAPAIGLALATALGSRIPLLAWRLPAMPQLLDWTYQWIADNRRRFRGDEPWCQADGEGKCSPDGHTTQPT